MKISPTILCLLVVGSCYGLSNRDLYDVVAQGSVTLPRGNEESVRVKLQTPIKFYTENYDAVYVSSSFGDASLTFRQVYLPCCDGT